MLMTHSHYSHSGPSLFV